MGMKAADERLAEANRLAAEAARLRMEALSEAIAEIEELKMERDYYRDVSISEGYVTMPGPDRGGGVSEPRKMSEPRRLSKEHLGVIAGDPAVEDVPKLLDHIAAQQKENERLRAALAAGDALADEAHRTQVWLTSVQPIRLDNLQRAIDAYRAARQRDGEEG